MYMNEKSNSISSTFYTLLSGTIVLSLISSSFSDKYNTSNSDIYWEKLISDSDEFFRES